MRVVCYLCAPQTEGHRPPSAVADFLGEEAWAWVVLRAYVSTCLEFQLICT